MNDDKFPIWRLLFFAFLGVFFAWCFFYVRGFAYDLEIGNYDFNGFDENADTIFIEWLENNADWYTSTTEENEKDLINTLKEHGYTDDYIEKFRIKVQTTKNEVVKEEDPVPVETVTGSDELTTENGATDAIVSDENMKDISEDKQNELFGDEVTRDNISTVETDNSDVIAVLEDILASQNALYQDFSDFYAEYNTLESEKTVTALEKPIESYTVLETIGLILVVCAGLGIVVFLCIKFVPSIGR